MYIVYFVFPKSYSLPVLSINNMHAETCLALCINNTFLFFSPSFYADFGPLNLAMLYRYCCKLNKKLKVSFV